MTVTEKESIIQNYNRQYQLLFQISSKGINQSPPETGLENTSCKVVLNSCFVLFFHERAGINHHLVKKEGLDCYCCQLCLYT